MTPEAARPFDSIESAHEFVALLEQSIEDAILEVKDHIQSAANPTEGERDERSTQALTLAIYKMQQLSTHMHKSRRILNDLRTIRRLLFQERDA